jgi:hypothetical protein
MRGAQFVGAGDGNAAASLALHMEVLGFVAMSI